MTAHRRLSRSFSLPLFLLHCLDVGAEKFIEDISVMQPGARA